MDLHTAEKKRTDRPSSSERIRILHILDKLSKDGCKIHGPARQLLYRLPYYDSNSLDVMVVSMKNEVEVNKLFRDKGIKAILLDRKKFDLFVMLDLWRIIRKWKPSLIHLHGYASWNFGRILGCMMGTPIVIQEHFIDSRIPLYQETVDWCLRGVRGSALAVSEAVKEFMVNKRHVKDDIKVILNSVPFDKYCKPDEKEVQNICRQYGLSPDVKVVGIVGRLGEGKGHKYFLEAARKVLDQLSGVAFFIVGEGPFEDDLRNRVKEMGLNGHVFFTGYQKEVLKYFALFDVSVIASVSEGFPGVGIESFLSGTPLVCTDLPGVRGIYEHNKNVLIIPLRDPDAMASAIMNILKDKKIADKLVRNGKSIAERCSTDKIAEAYTDYYKSIISREKAVHLK
jgi:glycosyltransferase involved in cell wall biosynthesis